MAKTAAPDICGKPLLNREPERRSLIHTCKDRTMPEQKLRQLVANLHDELSRTSSVDDESRELLRELTGDIDKLVSADAVEHRASAAGQVSEAAARFESDHPRLAAVLGEIVDTLAKLGI